MTFVLLTDRSDEIFLLIGQYVGVSPFLIGPHSSIFSNSIGLLGPPVHYDNF